MKTSAPSVGHLQAKMAGNARRTPAALSNECKNRREWADLAKRGGHVSIVRVGTATDKIARALG
ncbi:MAG: hypothetical protein ING75_00150 [Rhodocyclaceae bacterium]|nr:hypothetical protein [Rhodocyclaceae bacterium]